MKDFTYLAPPADGLHQAMADARGRRLRTAGFSTTAAATALFVAVAVLGGQSTQSLVQQPTPEQPAITHVVPGPATVEGGTSNTVSMVASHRASFRGQPGANASAGPATRFGPAGNPAHDAPTDTAGKPYAPGKITRSDGTFYLPTDPSCNVTGRPSDATSLCPSSNAYSSGSTRVYTLYGDVCSTRTNTTALHFPGRNEVDLTVRAGSKEVWRWSRWHPNAEQPHVVAIPTGACSQWSFDWTIVDAQGRALPKGDYTLTVTFLAAELAGRNTSTYAFTVT